MKRRYDFILGLAVTLASGFASAEYTVNFTNRVDAIRPALHSAAYSAAFSDPTKEQYDSTLKELNMAYSRTHDWGLNAEGHRVIDTHFIFPVESADVDDPNSYYFKASDDMILRTIEKTGSQIFFRLGNSIDKTEKHYNSTPPKSNQKWAQVCEHIIRHYNEGWNNGFHLGIKYWEIWNEPDLASNPCWLGTWDEFATFFATVIAHLQTAFPKSDYPDLRFGGPAIAEYTTAKFDKLVTACDKKGSLPDFFSWHYYGTDVSKVTSRSKDLHTYLTNKKAAYGTIGRVIDEWHFCDWNSTDGEYDRCGVNSAAFTAACHCNFQNTADDDKYELACMYGIKLTGSWGVMDSNYQRHHVFYAMKMVGEMMTNCVDHCKTSGAADPVYLLAGRSEDGRTGKLLVSYYKIKDTSTSPIAVRLLGLGENPSADCVKRVERIAASTAAPSVLTDWTLEGGVLTLPKPKGSAVYLITFDIPAAEED